MIQILDDPIEIHPMPFLVVPALPFKGNRFLISIYLFLWIMLPNIILKFINIFTYLKFMTLPYLFKYSKTINPSNPLNGPFTPAIFSTLART